MHSEFYVTDLLEIEALFLMQQEIAAILKEKKMKLEQIDNLINIFIC